MLRIISTPIIVILILYDYSFIAFRMCLLSIFSDGLDGYIARTYNKCTRFGSFLDPFADKIFIGSLSITLAI